MIQASFPTIANRIALSDIAKGAAGKATTQKLEQQINQRLLSEARKNQCTFKTDTDVLEKGCEQKLRKILSMVYGPGAHESFLTNLPRFWNGRRGPGTGGTSG